MILRSMVMPALKASKIDAKEIGACVACRSWPHVPHHRRRSGGGWMRLFAVGMVRPLGGRPSLHTSQKAASV